MKGFVKKCIAKLPMQIRYGSSMMSFVNKVNINSKEHFERYVVNKFNALLDEWKEMHYRESCLNGISKINTVVDFESIKLNDKKTIVELRKHLKNIENYSEYTSGGTTGKPLQFMFKKRIGEDYFFAKRFLCFENLGYKGKKCSIDLTWAHNEFKPIFNYRFNWFSISPIRLHKNAAEFVRELIQQNKPATLIGYPSTITSFGEFIYQNGIEFQPEIIISGSEMMELNQFSIIKKYFPKARLGEWYGMSELAGFAYRNERGAYNFLPDTCYVELVDNDGKNITDPFQVGEIVLTGLNSMGTPFIRYKTGDLARNLFFNKEYGCQSIENIVGRVGQVLIGNKNEFTVSLLNSHDELLSELPEFQYKQKHRGFVSILFLKSSNNNIKLIEKYVDFLNEKMNGEIEFQYELVDELVRTSRGKKNTTIKI